MSRAELYARAGAASSAAFEFRGERCDNVVAAVFRKLSIDVPPGCG